MGGFDGHLEPAAEVAKGQGIMSSVYYWSYVVIVVVLFLNIAVAILVDSYGTYATNANANSTQPKRCNALPSACSVFWHLHASA
eukprot:COSAG06_NODE_270_length_18720_cov_149.982708_6_plen_84_part_00